jgi:hypothetical protein
MRFYIIFLLALLVSCSSEKKGLNSKGSKNDQRKLETDEQILAALNDETGNDMDKKDVCIIRSTKFNDLILIGYFAYDRGCAGNDCFYKGNFKGISDISKAVMVDHGWSDESKRLDLVKEFMLDVSGAWETVALEEHEDFVVENQEWVEPQSEIVDDTYVASAWIRQGAGMRKARSYYKVKYIFEKDGALRSVNRSSRFSHEY